MDLLKPCSIVPSHDFSLLCTSFLTPLYFLSQTLTLGHHKPVSYHQPLPGSALSLQEPPHLAESAVCHAVFTMAEAVAVIGLTASIVQLLDAGKKVADRVREFQKNRAFAHLHTKLAVMNLILTRIKEAQESQPFATKTQEALLGAVSECQGLTTQLYALITRMSPAEEDSKFRRAFKGIRSFGKDQRLVEIQAKLDTAIDQLANYLAVDASLTSRTSALKLAENTTPLTGSSGLTPKAKGAIFDVPAQYVSIFVGRKTIMDDVAASFAKSDPDSAGPNVVVLVGMGGQGVSYSNIPFPALCLRLLIITTEDSISA